MEKWLIFTIMHFRASWQNDTQSRSPKPKMLPSSRVQRQCPVGRHNSIYPKICWWRAKCTSGNPALSLISTQFFRLSMTRFCFREKFLYSKIHLYFQCSGKQLQTKTNLAHDNSCFENNTDVCFFLCPIKLWGSHFVVKVFWSLWKLFVS